MSTLGALAVAKGGPIAVTGSPSEARPPRREARANRRRGQGEWQKISGMASHAAVASLSAGRPRPPPTTAVIPYPAPGIAVGGKRTAVKGLTAIAGLTSSTAGNRLTSQSVCAVANRRIQTWSDPPAAWHVAAQGTFSRARKGARVVAATADMRSFSPSRLAFSRLTAAPQTSANVAIGPRPPRRRCISP